MKMVYGYTDAEGNFHQGTVDVDSPEDAAAAMAMVRNAAEDGQATGHEVAAMGGADHGFAGVVGAREGEFPGGLQAALARTQAALQAGGLTGDEDAPLDELPLITIDELHDTVMETAEAEQQVREINQLEAALDPDFVPEVDPDAFELPDDVASMIARALTDDPDFDA